MEEEELQVEEEQDIVGVPFEAASPFRSRQRTPPEKRAH